MTGAIAPCLFYVGMIYFNKIATFGGGLDERRSVYLWREQRLIPVLFIMTSNCSEEYYRQIGYDRMLENYRNTLSGFVGPTKVMVCGDTLQVSDYSKYNWTMFDPEAKKVRHEEVFPDSMKKAFAFGAEMVSKPWE